MARISKPEWTPSAARAVVIRGAENKEQILGTLGNGRYALTRTIGLGGSCRIYEARDLATGNPVAIQVFDQRVSRKASDRIVRRLETTKGLHLRAREQQTAYLVFDLNGVSAKETIRRIRGVFEDVMTPHSAKRRRLDVKDEVEATTAAVALPAPSSNSSALIALACLTVPLVMLWLHAIAQFD